MKKDQTQTPLFDAIVGFIEADPVPFMVPGHKMGGGIHPKWKDYAGEAIFKMDLCEVHGLDDISQPSGAIMEAQELAADAWGAEHSYFLVNGTSSGIIASICTIAGEDDKIIVPRNAHKSVVFGLIISGAEPVYVTADISRDRGLVGGLDPAVLAKAYDENPEAKGVFSVSPTYHGICSDTKSLVDITHEHGGVFIADEAHGNHVYFHDNLPAGALTLGADLSCQSIHKMSGSLTQSSMLHVKSDRIDRVRLRSNLQMMMNTSPNYLLEVSLDLARSYMATEGREILGELGEMISAAKEEIDGIPGVSTLGRDLVGECSIFDFEPTRIVLSMRELGVDGYELYDRLYDDYRIEIEFGDYYYGVCVLGPGTKKDQLDRFVRAVKEIAEQERGHRAPLSWDEALPPQPPMAILPREAHFAKREKIPWADARGRVSAQMIVPYAPGIPTIYPGELITAEVWDFLSEQSRNKRHLHGAEDGRLDYISVVK
jgi:arginine/lysine/ornithine decarboxylase